MLTWILQISIISIIFIFLVHHLLCFFKTTLTVPKMKDLVNSPVKKYQDIFDTITNSNTNLNHIRKFRISSILAPLVPFFVIFPEQKTRHNLLMVKHHL